MDKKDLQLLKDFLNLRLYADKDCLICFKCSLCNCNCFLPQHYLLQLMTMPMQTLVLQKLFFASSNAFASSSFFLITFCFSRIFFCFCFRIYCRKFILIFFFLLLLKHLFFACSSVIANSASSNLWSRSCNASAFFSFKFCLTH